MKRVRIIMGNDSDLPVVEKTIDSAKNSALLDMPILAITDEELVNKLEYRNKTVEKVLGKNEKIYKSYL